MTRRVASEHSAVTEGTIRRRILKAYRYRGALIRLQKVAEETIRRRILKATTKRAYIVAGYVAEETTRRRIFQIIAKNRKHPELNSPGAFIILLKQRED